jgi:hypothetical protein
VLQRVAAVWADKKDALREQAADTMGQLAAALQSEGTNPSDPTIGFCVYFVPFLPFF